jgi:hypothetical protein
VRADAQGLIGVTLALDEKRTADQNDHHGGEQQSDDGFDQREAESIARYQGSDV